MTLVLVEQESLAARTTIGRSHNGTDIIEVQLGCTINYSIKRWLR